MIRKNKPTPPLFKKLFCLSIALLPILDIYSSFIPSISIGQLLVIILCFLAIALSFVHKIRLNNNFVVFFAYFFCVGLFSFLIVRDWNIGKNMLSLALYSFIAMISINIFNYKIFKNYYYFISAIIIILAIIQFLGMAFDKHIVFVIPFLKLENGGSYNSLQNALVRVEGCFTEPAHLVHYLSLTTIMVLADNKKRFKDILLLIFSVATSLLTFSGNAIISMLIIFIVYGFYFVKKKQFKKKVCFILAVLGLIILAVVLINTNETVKALYNRKDEILGMDPASISGYVRVLRGFELFAGFPIFNKLFGVGVGNVGNFISEHNIQGSVIVEQTHPLYTYLNGVHYSLISGGIVGTIIYLKFLLSGGHNKLHSYVFWWVVGLSFVSALYLSPTWLIMIVVLMSQKKYKNKKYFIKKEVVAYEYV